MRLFWAQTIPRYVTFAACSRKSEAFERRLNDWSEALNGTLRTGVGSTPQPPRNRHIQRVRRLKTNPQFSQISPNCLEFNCCNKRILFSPLPGKLGQCLRRKLHLSWLSPPPCSPQCLLSFYITFPSHHAAGGCGSSLSTIACCRFHHQANVSLLLKPPPPPASEKVRLPPALCPPQSKALLVKTLHLITAEINSHRGGVCSSPPLSTPPFAAAASSCGMKVYPAPGAKPLRYRCFPVCLRSDPAFFISCGTGICLPALPTSRI